MLINSCAGYHINQDTLNISLYYVMCSAKNHFSCFPKAFWQLFHIMPHRTIIRTMQVMLFWQGFNRRSFGRSLWAGSRCWIGDTHFGQVSALIWHPKSFECPFSCISNCPHSSICIIWSVYSQLNLLLALPAFGHSIESISSAGLCMSSLQLDSFHTLLSHIPPPL